MWGFPHIAASRLVVSEDKTFILCFSIKNKPTLRLVGVQICFIFSVYNSIVHLSLAFQAGKR